MVPFASLCRYYNLVTNYMFILIFLWPTLGFLTRLMWGYDGEVAIILGHLPWEVIHALSQQ